MSSISPSSLSNSKDTVSGGRYRGRYFSPPPPGCTVHPAVSIARKPAAPRAFSLNSRTMSPCSLFNYEGNENRTLRKSASLTAVLAMEDEELSRINVWEAAKAAGQDTSSDGIEAVVYFLGHKHTGKTSILSRILEDAEEYPSGRNEIGLDFGYGIHTSRDGEEFIYECYELCGNAVEQRSLINLPIEESKHLEKICIFLFVDLTQPQCIMDLLSSVMGIVKEGFDKNVKKLSPGKYEEFRQKLYERMHRLGFIEEEDHEDAEFRDLFPLPLIIVGSKFDGFLKMNPAQQKTLSRLLRNIAHSIGATLIYYSMEDENLEKRMHDLLKHYVCGTSFDYEHVTAQFEPLCITSGKDSFRRIFPAKKYTAADFTLEQLKPIFKERFGEVIYDKKSFKEPRLDPNFKSEFNKRHQEEWKKLKSGVSCMTTADYQSKPMRFLDHYHEYESCVSNMVSPPRTAGAGGSRDSA